MKNRGFMEIGKLGFGVYKIVDEEKLLNALNIAVNVGYKLIDTASFYKNEEYIGKFLKGYKNRDDLIITTKIWPSDMTYDKVLKAFDKSYKLLDNKVDIILLHWPRPDSYIESYKALERLYNEKVVKKIGVSNFEIDNLEKIKNECNIKPYLNQIELHPKLAQKELIKYNKENEILTQCWSPIGKARYFNDEVLLSIARKYNVTVANVILAWHIQNNLYPIPKSETPNRIIENYNSINLILDKDDLSNIDKLDCNYRLSHHPKKFPYGSI